MTTTSVTTSTKSSKVYAKQQRPKHATPPTAAAITAQLLQQKYANELAKVLKQRYPEWLQMIEKHVKQQKEAREKIEQKEKEEKEKEKGKEKEKEKGKGKEQGNEKEEEKELVEEFVDEITMDQINLPLPQVSSIDPNTIHHNNSFTNDFGTKRSRKRRESTKKSSIELSNKDLLEYNNKDTNNEIQEKESFIKKKKSKSQTQTQTQKHKLLFENDISDRILNSTENTQDFINHLPSFHHSTTIPIDPEISSSKLFSLSANFDIPRTLRRDCFFSLPLQPTRDDDTDIYIDRFQDIFVPSRSISPSLTSDTGSIETLEEYRHDLNGFNDNIQFLQDRHDLNGFNDNIQFLQDIVDLTTEIPSPNYFDNQNEPIIAPIVKSQNDINLFSTISTMEYEFSIPPAVINPLDIEHSPSIRLKSKGSKNINMEEKKRSKRIKLMGR